MDGSGSRTPRETGASPSSTPSLPHVEVSNRSTSASAEQNALSGALLQSTEDGDFRTPSPVLLGTRAANVTTNVGTPQARRYRRRNVSGNAPPPSRSHHTDVGAVGMAPEGSPSSCVPTGRNALDVGGAAQLPKSRDGDSERGSLATTQTSASHNNDGACSASSGTLSGPSSAPTDDLPRERAGLQPSALRRQTELEAPLPLSTPPSQTPSAAPSDSPPTSPATRGSLDGQAEQPTQPALSRPVSVTTDVSATSDAASPEAALSLSRLGSIGSCRHAQPPTFTSQLATPPERHARSASLTSKSLSSSPPLATVAHGRRSGGEAAGHRLSRGASPVLHRPPPSPSSAASSSTAESTVATSPVLSATSARPADTRAWRRRRRSSTDSVTQTTMDGGAHRFSETTHFTGSSAPAATVEQVWPFTEPLELRAIASHVRQRMEWNLMLRQVIVTLPLLVLASLYAAFNSPATSYDVTHTESLRQLFERPTFPSTESDLEAYRQHHILDLHSANLGENRHFAEIRTQTDWIHFFADVMVPRAFPGAGLSVHDPVNVSFCSQSETEAASPDSVVGDPVIFVEGSSFGGDEEDVSSQHTSIDADLAIHVIDTARVGDASGGSNIAGDGDVLCTLRATLLYDEPPSDSSEHIFLGAMRARTIRMRNNTAILQTGMYPPETVPFPRDGWDRHGNRVNEETVPSRCPSVTMVSTDSGAAEPLYVYHSPEESNPYCVRTAGLLNNYHCGGYSFQVPFRATARYAAMYRAAIRNTSCFFLDNWATRLAVVEFFTYTPSTDSFHLVKYRTEVAAGGNYVNTAVYRSFPVWTPARIGELVYVCVTAAYVVFFLGTLLLRVYEKGRYGAGVVAVLVDWSAWLDIGAVVSLNISFVYYFMWVRLSIEVAPQLVVPLESDAYPAFLDAVAELCDRRNITAVVGLLLCFNRLCTLRAVLRPMDSFLIAMERSTWTLVAISVTFMAVVAAYALVAWAAFASFADHFSTFGASLFTCLIFWTSTDIVVPESDNADFWFNFLFFWSLTMVLGVVTVALLLATITHSFAQVQKEQGVTYNRAWLMSRLSRIRRAATWPHVRRLLAKVFCLFPENEYLRRLLVRMEAVYGAASLGHLGGGRAKRRSSLPSWWDTSATPPMTERNWESSNDLGGAFTPASAPSQRGSVSRTASSLEVRSHVPMTPLPAFVNPLHRGLGGTVSSVDGTAPRQQPPAMSQGPHQLQYGRRWGTGGESSNEAPSASRGDRSVSMASVHSCWSDYAELRRRYEELRTAAATALQRGPRADFFEWTSVIPHEVLVKCGGIAFFADWWVEMAEAQAEIAQTPEEQGRRLLREEASIATEREVAVGVVSISQLDTTLSHLEAHVDKLLHNVSRR